MAGSETEKNDRNREICKMKKTKIFLSSFVLLLANVITIYFAVKNDWTLFTLIWIYWSQSVLIGIFSFLKIIIPAVKHKNAGRLSAGLFFLMHYGFFHIGYLIFLGIYTFFLGKEVMFYSVLLGAGVFLADHAFSYFYNRKYKIEEEKIGKLMLMPYLRILPIHIIIGMTSLGFSLLLFMILKTVADLAGHVIEGVYK